MERKIETFSWEGMSIEYSVVGKGEPIFVMHGGHSNCHEEMGYKGLVDNGFSIITPSRAGYGGTSKEVGKSLSTACECYCGLMRHLNIEKVHLLAISAGGPSGIYFAAHYPKLVKTLTLQSAVTKRWIQPKDKEYIAAKIIFQPFSEKVTWTFISALGNRFPQFVFRQMFSSFSNLIYSEAKDKIADSDIEALQKMNNRQRSGSGFMVDLTHIKELTITDLQTVTCPTLIMHSKHDAAVSLEHPYHAHQHIPLSELCLLESWGHLIWLGNTANKSEEKTVQFLKLNHLS
ncbi:alpha/beta fold hydrolase [Planococcus soli]|uniref:alpha/beta fold hydrolase n=1 Tax=Planococcus soli TaxID=2666072 RepID=UPI00115D38A5|nr:alpha/beta hydrolase [Planococcus soli]